MQNIDIRLKPSKTAIFAVIVAWIGGTIAIFIVHFFFFLTLLLLFTLTFYAAIIFRKDALLRGPNAIQGLRHLTGNQWQITRNQDSFIAKLLGDSTVTSQLCVLRFRVLESKTIYSYILVKDSFESDMYRRLLLCLAT